MTCAQGVAIDRYLTSLQGNDCAILEGRSDEGGFVEHRLQPLFTSSCLITVRLPLPFELSADPVSGCWRVMEDGYGLRVGDVLRAFSTLVMRYDSEKREMRVGPGVPGMLPDAPTTASSEMPEWLSAFQSNFNPFTAFETQRPAKCLFIADGEPHDRVQDALVANEKGKGVSSIVLIFERADQVKY